MPQSRTARRLGALAVAASVAVPLAALAGAPPPRPGRAA